MNIPRREDIDVFGSRDEQTACRHFLGKTVDEAEILFREAVLVYQEDLMWMGPVAFRYYLQGLIQYIRSDSAIGDADAINCLAGILEFRLQSNADALSPVLDQLSNICMYVVHFNDKFDSSVEFYGDLRARFSKLAKAFKGVVKHES